MRHQSTSPLLHLFIRQVVDNSTGSTSPDNSDAKPLCGGGGLNSADDYNMGLHIGALFIILATSTFGSTFPIFSKRVPALRIPERVFLIAKFFGSGVIIATAFIHMMPSAFESLSDPCLPDFWIDTYTAAPGAIAMAAAVMIFLVEFGSTRYLATVDRRLAKDAAVTSFDPAGSDDGINKIENGDGAHKHEYNGINNGDHYGHHHVIPPPPEGHLDRHTEATQKLGVAILEAGIIFHSVFIGLTLAISTGSDFISLFITIIFHQTFEGLALGSRIATLAFKPKDWRPYVMAATYAFTTPIGIAIGMGVRTSYDPNSQTALISAGVFDSVSAGLLIYAGMVELLAHDFIHGEMRTAPKGRVLLAIGSLLVGAALMALLGRWA